MVAPCTGYRVLGDTRARRCRLESPPVVRRMPLVRRFTPPQPRIDDVRRPPIHGGDVQGTAGPPPRPPALIPPGGGSGGPGRPAPPRRAGGPPPAEDARG